MEKRKNIIGASVITGAVLAVTGFAANAAGLFNYQHLGTGSEVRSNLLDRKDNSRTLELACGAKSKTDSTAKKGQDGKCGEQKKTDSTAKKVKDAKCGEGKCGGTKKKN